MRAFPIISMVLLSFLLSGCQSFPDSFKGLSLFNNNKSIAEKAAPVATATSVSKAVDKIAEISKKEEETKQALDAEYAKFRSELAIAYKNREQVDDANFDLISEINYGIFKSTEEITHLDTRILIANLKAKENMARLMPIDDSKRKQIQDDIESDRKKTEAEIAKKYESKIKLGEAAALAYEKADQEVKQKEAEKTKLKADQEETLTKLRAEQENQKSELRKQSVDAVTAAKEQQRVEMLGWLIKSLGGIGIIALLVGIFLRSPTFILSGIALLGLAYIAATIPFWVVSTIMGIVILIMVLIDPKTGHPHLVHPETPAAPVVDEKK